MSSEEVQEKFIEEVGMEDVPMEAPVERLRQATSMEPAREDTFTSISTSASSSEIIADDVEEVVPVLSRAATRQPTRKSTMLEPEPDFEALVMRMRQTTLRTDRHDSIKAPSPAAEEQIEPVVSQWPSRQSTRRTSVPESQPEPVTELEAATDFEAPMMWMRQSTMPPSRRQSLRSPSPILEEEAGPSVVTRISTRRPTRKATAIVASPAGELESDAPVTPLRRASTIPPPPTPESKAIGTGTRKHTPTPPRDASPGPVLRETTTRRPPEHIPSPEPAIRKASTRRTTQRVPSSEPMVRRVTTRRPMERYPSPESVVRRITTRMPTEGYAVPELVIRKMSTRRPTERVSSPEPVVERALTRQPTERSPSLEPVIRTATTRRPTARIPSPEPVIERALSRRTTELLPPLEEIIRRVTTRKRTELVQEPPAPPSSPSTEAEEPVLLAIMPTARIEDDVQDAELTEDPPLVVSRTAEVLSRTVTLAPEFKRQSTVPSSRTTTLRRRPTQPEQIFLPESSSSVSSHASPMGEDDRSLLPEVEPEEFVPPVERIRKPTTVFELSPDDVLSEPTFDRQPMVPRRQPTLRRSPIASRQPTVVRQPTVQERRATFERAMTIPSRRSTIMSDPTNVDPDPSIVSRVSMRQAAMRDSLAPSRISTTISRKPTESISRQLTRRGTDAEAGSAPLKRQVTRQVTIPPSRKPSEYEVPNLMQRNAEEGSDVKGAFEQPEETPSAERRATRQPTTIDQQPTIVSRKSSRAPTEQIEETGMLGRQTTRQSTLRSETWEETGNIEDEPEPEPVAPVAPVRRDREPTRVFREPTRLERQDTLSVQNDEVPGSSSNSSRSTSITEAPVVLSRQATRTLTSPSRRTTVSAQREATMQLAPQTPEQESSSLPSELEAEPESMPEPEQLPTRRATTMRTTTGLTVLTTSSSEPQEYGSMERNQERAASRRATLERAPTEAEFEPPIMRMRQDTELEEPQQYHQDESELEPVGQIQSRRASRALTQPIDTAPSKLPSRRSTWSTEALAEEELSDDTSSVSGQGDVPVVERQASVVSRTPTAVSRTPTNFSRRPTRQLTVVSRQATLQQPDSLLDPADLPVERIATELSRQPAELAPSPSPCSESTLSFVSSPDVLEDELPAPATRVATRKATGVLRRATAKESSPPTQTPPRQAMTVSRQPTARDESPQSFMAVGRMAEHDSDSAAPQEDEHLEDVQYATPSRKTTEQLSRKPTRVPAQRQAQEEPVVEPIELEAPSEMGPAPASRMPSSQITRQPTRVSTQREVLADETSPADEEVFQAVTRAAEISTGSSSEVVEPKEVADLVRQPTAMSRKPTRIPTQPPTKWPDEELALLPRRATTRISCQPTRATTTVFEPLVQRDAQPEEDVEELRVEANDEITSVPRRATTRVSRQPTRVATAPFGPPVQRDVQADPVDAPATVAEPDSSHSSILDEPLAAYDVYHALPEAVPDVVAEEAPRPVSRMPTRKDSVVRVQEEPSATNPPASAPPLPSRSAPTRAPTRKPTMVATDSETSVHMSSAERTERAPTIAALELIPKAVLEPDRIEKAPTVVPSQELVPLVRRDAKTSPTESPKIGRQKTRFSPKIDEHPPPGLTPPSSALERDRKPSTAAPGIVAPPPPLIQRDRKPTDVERKPRKKMYNYPPEQQYPPAPAYPVRDTPAWTKPDTYTPPPKPKPEPAPKKRGFFGLGIANQSLKCEDLLSPTAIEPSSPFATRHQDRYQDLLGERYKGQEVTQPHLDTNPSIELQLLSPSEGMTVSLDLPQSTLARTITTPDSHRSHRTAETTIHKPNLHQSGETSKRHRRVRQSEETLVRNPPILQPQPIETIPRATRSQLEPEGMSPLVTRLASQPFVAKRRSPLAINLQRNKTFVTKRRPLLGLKRLHLNVGRRLTKNPLARAQYRGRRLSQGLFAETPAATPKQKGLRFRNRRRIRQETGQRQKRSLKSPSLRRKRISRADRQDASQVVQQPQSKVAIADRRRLPRLLLSGRRSKGQHQGSSRQGGAVSDALQNRKHRRARKKTKGISLPSLRRKIRETVPAEPVSTASALPTPDPSSRARMRQSPQSQGGERQAKIQLRDTRDHQVEARVIDERQLRTPMEDSHQHQVQERQKRSRERQPVQSTKDERLKHQLPKQREKARQPGREDPRLRLGEHQRNVGRRLPEKTRNPHLQREHPRSRTDLQRPVDKRQQRPVRQYREQQTQEPLERQRQLREQIPRTRQGQSSVMEDQSRAQQQQSSDRSQRERLPNYRDAAPPSLYTIQAPQTRMQYLNVPRPRNQSRNQAERIQYLPRAPQREAGLEARERARFSNRQPRQQVLERDERQVRRRTRS
ncbi:hypothetical protein E8E11_003568 [Didymella keratinophila]|nr:hypothetical protein E8E11_003568 [Didymella keratinophila]